MRIIKSKTFKQMVFYTSEVRTVFSASLIKTVNQCPDQNVQADLGLYSPHIPEYFFPNGGADVDLFIKVHGNKILIRTVYMCLYY